MNDILEKAYSAEDFRAHAHALVDVLADYLKNPSALPTQPYRHPDEMLAFWQEDFEHEQGTSPAIFFKKVLENSVHLHNPHYIGHQVSATAPLAALTTMLSSLLNNGNAVYEMGASSSALERIVCQEINKKVGFGTQSDGILTSGGTLANLTALLAARQIKGGDDVWESGNENKKFALLVSEEAHYCVARAAKIMGWGSDGVIKIPADARFSMRTELLEKYYFEALDKGLTPIAVVGSACATATGGYDNLNALADFCEKFNLWLHIDGAHGAAVVFSQKYKHLVAGLQRADSVVIDLHKMLLTPSLATALLFRDGEHSYQTFAQKADYLLSEKEKDWYNFAKRTFECTKYMMSIKFYALWRTYGDSLFENFIDTTYDQTRHFADLLSREPDFETAHAPQSNILCFRYAPAHLPKENLTTLNATIRQKLLEKGDFYIVQTTIKGEIYLRITVMNPFTSEMDFKQLLTAIRNS